MIVRAIVLGIEEDEIEELRQLYSYAGTEAFVRNYMEWDDARFMLTFGAHDFEGKYCHELVTRLKRLRLLKQVFASEVSQLPESCRDMVADITKPKNREIRRCLEGKLAHIIDKAGYSLECNCKDRSHLVIVNSYTLKSVRAQARNDEGSIPVVKKGSKVTTFEEASDLFRSIDDKMVRPQFAVYAPLTYNNPAERRKLTSKLHDLILTCLDDFGKELLNG